MEKSISLKQVIGNNISFLLSAHHISRKKLCEDLNIKYTTLSDWVNGKTYPRIDSLELVADYFSIDIKCFFDDIEHDETLKNRILAYAGRLSMEQDFSHLYPEGFFDLFGSLSDWDFVEPEELPLDDLEDI